MQLWSGKDLLADEMLEARILGVHEDSRVPRNRLGPRCRHLPRTYTRQWVYIQPRKVDVKLPGKGKSNSHGARPVHVIITMMEWIRTSRLSKKSSVSLYIQRVVKQHGREHHV